jgi:hypothetical protein
MKDPGFALLKTMFYIDSLLVFFLCISRTVSYWGEELIWNCLYSHIILEQSI